MDSDPFVDDIREQITALDRSIFDALNRRIELVVKLKRHKDEHGYSFLDPDREQRMVNEQVEANPGPLSEAGLREIYRELLALVKREVD